MNDRKSFFSRILRFFLPREKDIHLSIFRLIAVGGIITSIATAFYNLAMGFGFWNFLSIIVAGVSFSLAMIIYTHRTGQDRIPISITVFVVFIGLFSYLFFTSGGYRSGIPLFFVMAIVFTAFMLNGAIMPILVTFELLWYVGLCLFAYYNPETIDSLLNYNEADYVLDIIVSVVISSVVLASTAYFEVRIYRKKQIELEQTRIRAEKANEAKTDFIARMSHDVRTPLNTIMAMNELIVQNTSSKEIREWVEDSNNSAQILLSLVNDMLDISRIEAGRAEIYPQSYKTTSFFFDLEKSWEPMVVRAGLHFIANNEPDIPSKLIGDRVALRKIVDNLMSNAVKYTKSGNIVLKYGFDHNEDCLVISVIDTGSGIEKYNLEKIFKPFERGSVETAIQGSGLGLAIVNELTECMKGTVTCESEVGIGSSFTVKLPQEIEDPTPIGSREEWHAEENSKHGKGIRKVAPGATVLVVDDNLYNRKVISQLLDPLLISVDDVESGQEALEMIDIKHYDLILMDLRMPEMSGTETFEKIMEEYPGFDTPVVALTAEIIGGVEEKVLNMGFSGYLSKPVSSAQLYETIEKFAPDKVVTMEEDSDEGVADEDITALQDRLSPYGINIRLALDYNAGDIKEFLMRTALFDECAPNTIKLLEKYKGSREYYVQVHSVKSVAKGIGAWLLSDIAEAVELREDDEYSDCAHDLLIKEYQRVREGINILRDGRNNAYEEQGNDN